MLDFHLDIKWRDTSEDNGNSFFALVLDLAEAIGPAWVGKACCRASINFLLHHDGVELPLLLHIVLVFELDEVVLILASMASVERQSGNAHGSQKFFCASILWTLVRFCIYLIFNGERRAPWRTISNARVCLEARELTTECYVHIVFIAFTDIFLAIIGSDLLHGWTL